MNEELRVNYSDEELASEARDFEPLPTGKYWVKITDGEIAEVGEGSKNAGKNYYRLTFTVQGGKHEGRYLWSNIMLFDGALYSLVQLLKALDLPLDGSVPAIDDLVGRDVIVGVVKARDKYREERDGTGEPLFKNEVKNFRKYTDEDAAKLLTAGSNVGSSSAGSLLP